MAKKSRKEKKPKTQFITPHDRFLAFKKIYEERYLKHLSEYSSINIPPKE